jgi:hypothetical protein
MNTVSRFRIVALLLVAAMAVGGCGTIHIGPDDQDPVSGPMRCGRSDDRPSGMQVLLAQAVPTAPVVPCLRSDAGNWTITGFQAENGRAWVEFSYRDGDDDTATIDLKAGCDVRAALEVSSQFDGMRKYNRPATRGDRYGNETHYVYPGACASLRFDLSGSGADLRGAEIAGALGFVTRESLDQQIRKASNNHLRLDPAQPPG